MSYEEAARKQGWVPQEEWNGNPDQWVDAKEFVYRGELLGRIKDQSKQIQSLRKNYDTEVKGLREKMLKMGEQWTKDRLSNINLDLEAAQKAYENAIRDDDPDRASALKDYMGKLTTEKQEFETTSKELEDEKNDPANQLTSLQKDLQSEMQNFIKRNDWYGRDVILTNTFNLIGDQLAEQGEYTSAEELVEMAYDALKEEMPHKFPADEEEEEDVEEVQPKPSNRRQTRQAVEPEVTPTRGAKGKDRFRSLSEDEERVARNFERTGVMTRKEYIDQLKAMERG